MLIERLMRIALFGSEWVLYLLLLLSVVSFSTMLERWFFFRKRRVDLAVLLTDVRKKLEKDDVEGVERLLESNGSFEARIGREALRWARGGADAMSDAVDSEIARAKSELERGTNLLGTLGNNAPFVGLFGTVLGVIIAFHALGDAGGNAGQMGGVMAGIAEALVATGVGLFVALPAVVGYNVIQKRIGEIEAGALALTKLLTAYVKSGGPIAWEIDRSEAEPADDRGEASEAEGVLKAETSNGSTASAA
ncbi:MAG TPA: MotA/TolQ/ExbB proton channel family protein [Polyangiaceae bacterium]